MEQQYVLQIKDGRYVQCYYWESRHADFGVDVATAWRGNQADVLRLQREWSVCDRPREAPFKHSRYIVNGSFCSSIITLHTYALSSADAHARFKNTFTEGQILFVLGGELPSIVNIDTERKDLSKFWKHHNYTYYEV